MMKRKYIFPAVLLFLAGSPALSYATHIHFEDLYNPDPDVTLNTGDSITWEYDLNNDPMMLWKLPDNEVHNIGEDYDEDLSYTGNMDPEDILHYAYLTLKFSDIKNDQSDPDLITILFEFDSLDQSSDEYAAGFTDPVESDESPYYTWVGAEIETTLMGGGDDPNNINVWSYLTDDHILTIKLTATDGSFLFESSNLSGCFEDVVPVPEPATMLLFGTGLAGVAGFARKKFRA